MITTYIDTGCKALKSPLGLKLPDEYSALWFCAEKGSNFSHHLSFMSSIFSPLVGYCWCAFSGGAESSKILELKRAFGHWSIPKKYVVTKHNLLDENGNRLYSDIAKIKAENINALAPMLNRSLFGVDSTIFYLPASVTLQPNNVENSLVDLLVTRNGMGVIDESELNQGLLEAYIVKVVSIGGVATIAVRDSNMRSMIVAIGSHMELRQIGKRVETKLSELSPIKVISEVEFNHMVSVGVSVSVFGY